MPGCRFRRRARVGALFDVNLTDSWVLSSAVDFFYLPVGDITAQAWRARINARYVISRTVAVRLGYGMFDIEVGDTTEQAESTIAYDMDGFVAGLTFSF